MGDEASYPTPQELRDSRTTWRDDCFWTGPRQAQPGDLLFFYFMAPRKAIHFIARAAGHPTFDPTITVNAVHEVDPNQWWIAHTPLVQVEPVGFKALQDSLGGHLNLRGKPSHYIPPEVAATLLRDLTPLESSSEADRAVAKTPVGDAGLPDPRSATPTSWSAMADGPLKLERQVEQYVVEPLLRFALPTDPRITWQQAYRIKGGGIPDYVVLGDGSPTGVIEVKIGVRESRNRDWRDSPDFQQVMRYSAALDVPAILVDSNRVFLIDRGSERPHTIVHRSRASPADMALIGTHLTAT